MYEPKVTGRAGVILNEAISFVLIISSPLLCLFYWIAYRYFDASLFSAKDALLSEGFSQFFLSRLPLPTATSGLAYTFWLIFQAALYIFIPGLLHQAPRTPGGRCLTYRLNGLNSWTITIILAVVASYTQLIDPAYIAKQWGEVLATANLYCAVLIVIFYVKARLFPDNHGETLITGHFWYDVFNGGELHPRTGRLFDWKHFNASRSGGLLAWTLIDLSFVSLQYQLYGSVTRSMILTTVFRVVIVLEYFYYENWFFETLDGAHERFSFYSIYGFAGIMPHIWTLQTQYLAYHPVELTTPAVIGIATFFALGWALNHYANDQKNLARRMGGKCVIWGHDAKFIKATYHTADGKIHHTLLLCSGWWGVVRHANYVGSLIYTWASCLTCGTGHLFPYTEALMLTAIVIHRCLRDEARCRKKYKEAWDEYCQLVKWRMIPGIY